MVQSLRWADQDVTPDPFGAGQGRKVPVAVPCTQLPHVLGCTLVIRGLGFLSAQHLKALRGTAPRLLRERC